MKTRVRFLTHDEINKQILTQFSVKTSRLVLHDVTSNNITRVYYKKGSLSTRMQKRNILRRQNDQKLPSKSVHV